MKKFVGRFFKEERGSVLILVAFVMVALIGITAVAIDGGRLYIEKSILQKAADAGALAGAQELPMNSSAAVTSANEVAAINNRPASNIEIGSGNKWIRVTTSSTVDLTFGKIFGYATVPVEAKAKVELNPLTSGTGVIPLGIDMDDYDLWKGCTSIVLKLPSPSNGNGNGNGNSNEEVPEETKSCSGSNNLGSGNTGPLEITGSGADNYRTDLRDGAKKEVSIGDILKTESGNMVGPTIQAVQHRIASCSDTDYNPSNLDCKRIVIVPVYKIHSGNKNKVKEVQVVAFATFFILKVDSPKNGAEVTGKFIDFTALGDSSPTQTDYGTYGYKLVE